MKMNEMLICMIILVSSNVVFADNSIGNWARDCGPATVEAIQAQKGEVLVSIKSTGEEGWTVWKSIGKTTDIFIDSYQSLVQQAMAQNKQVLIRFPIEENCSETNYSSSPLMVRVIN